MNFFTWIRKYIYSPIINCVLNFILWINFILSVISFYINSKKKITLIHTENWHLAIPHFNNTRKYSNFLKKNYSVIYIKLDSELMCFFLNLFLNTKKKKFFFKKNYSKIFRNTLWSIYLRICNLKDLEKIDITNQTKYINFFNSKTNKLFKKLKIDNLSIVFNNKNISAVLLTQIAYSEIYIYYFAALNKKKIIFWGEKNLDLNYPYKSISKKIHSAHLLNKKEISNSLKKKAITVFQKRYSGNYKNFNNYKFPLEGKFNSNVNFSFSDNLNKPTLFLYLHCFSDSPFCYYSLYENNLFFDFYHASLFVIDFAINNNYKLFIKVHPQSSLPTFKNDFFFINNIKKKIQGNKNIFFVNDLNLNNIKKSYKPVIITCFGTITLESAYAGIPVITLANSYYNYTSMSLHLRKKKDFKFLINNSYKLYKFTTARKEAIYYQSSHMYNQQNFFKNYKL